MAKRFVKDPDAVLDFQIDWSQYLETSDTISTSAWTVPSGITEDSDTNTTTTATIWLSGGTEGVIYALTNRIVTASGRTDDRTIMISVIESTGEDDRAGTMGDTCERVIELLGRKDFQEPGRRQQLYGFINAGQRMLDEMLDDLPTPTGRYVETLAAGDFYSVIQYVRWIDRVRVTSEDDDILYDLDKKDLDWLLASYPGDPTGLDRGRPKYWAYNTTGLAPGQWGTSLTAYTHAQDVETGTTRWKDGIIFMPPSDDTHQLQVWGHFYQPYLDDEADVSYWTQEESIMLDWATAYQVEVSQRNTEGANDWMGAIALRMKLKQGNAINKQMHGLTPEQARMEG